MWLSSTGKKHHNVPAAKEKDGNKEGVVCQIVSEERRMFLIDAKTYSILDK